MQRNIFYLVRTRENKPQLLQADPRGPRTASRP